MRPHPPLRRLALPALLLAASASLLLTRSREPRLTVPAEASPAPPAAPRGFHRVPGNLLQNAGFETNAFNYLFARDRRFLLLHASDFGLDEEDGHIDHWSFERRVPLPDSWDTAVARTGERSVRFSGPGRGFQRVRFAGEQYWRTGGAAYAQFLPLERSLAAGLVKRPIVAGVWCRTRDVPADQAPQLTLRVEVAERPGVEKERTPPRPSGTVEASVAFSPGTHDWEYREVRIEPERLPGTPWFAVVTLSAGRGGTVWFDDASLVEELVPALPNLARNGDFEAPEGADWPDGWGRPEPWNWMRNPYYAWTGWSHGNTDTWRGGATLDRAVRYRGGSALRFTVYPGDRFAVAGAPIALNQDRPRPIEVRATVKADRLRGLEIMARDETGEWLPQGDFLGHDMEDNPPYYMGTTGAGTYDWMTVRKFFAPRRPVRSLRLYLCVRGFDGVLGEKNVVGTLWIDDVQLYDHDVRRAAGRPAEPRAGGAAREAPDPAAPRPAPASVPRVLDIDLGERIWGRNTARVTLEASAATAPECGLELRLTDPAGRSRTFPGTVERFSPPEGDRPGTLVLAAEYRVDRLCASWKEQYRLALRLTLPGGRSMSLGEFPFGTPRRILDAGTSAYYAYPSESVVLYANLNVARGSFEELDRCEIVVTAGGERRKLTEVREFAALLRPQAGPKYANTRRVVRALVGAEGFRVHPWNEPTRDIEAVVRLYRKGPMEGAPLAESEPIRFGFMERVPPPELPERIERTGVDARGYLTVNGAPFFPVYWTPHFGILPEANYPPDRHGYRVLDLTPLVLGSGGPPDERVRAAILSRVAEARDDPRFFQYELGEGEQQLQPNWQQKVQWLKTAIRWIREADPNHLINGPRTWLVGHPRRDAAIPAFVPDWDAIGIEASFEEVPDLRAVRAAEGRRTAALVGLETYHYQSPETLRWRGYRAVLNGAAGVGLCPSGMLRARPDRENFLRGLNGEFRGLGPIITAAAPRDRLTVDSPRIETMERLHAGKRYLIAVRDAEAGGPLWVSFRFPAGSRFRQVRVLFEGRTLAPAADGFRDEFAGPRAVHVYELAP